MYHTVAVYTYLRIKHVQIINSFISNHDIVTVQTGLSTCICSVSPAILIIIPYLVNSMVKIFSPPCAQSRFGDKLLIIRVLCPHIYGSAVLKGLLTTVEI